MAVSTLECLYFPKRETSQYSHYSWMDTDPAGHRDKHFATTWIRTRVLRKEVRSPLLHPISQCKTIGLNTENIIILTSQVQLVLLIW